METRDEVIAKFREEVLKALDFPGLLQEIREALVDARELLDVPQCRALGDLEEILSGELTPEQLATPKHVALDQDQYVFLRSTYPEHPMWVAELQGEWHWVPDERVVVTTEGHLRITFKKGDPIVDTGITNEQVEQFILFIEQARAKRRERGLKTTRFRNALQEVKRAQDKFSNIRTEHMRVLLQEGSVLHLDSLVPASNIDRSGHAHSKEYIKKIQLVRPTDSDPKDLWRARAYTARGTFLKISPFDPSRYLSITEGFENLNYDGLRKALGGRTSEET